MAPQPQCNKSWRLYSLCNKEQRSPVGNIASMSTWRQELPMLQGNLCMMRDTSGHRQPLHTFSPIAVRANYYPTISIQFDHPHYHFIANISFIPTWGIISVKYTHYGRLLWAALLIIPAHMDNGSSKKKQKKKSQSRTMGPLGISCIRAASPARPSLAAALSSNSPAPGFLNAIPISLEGMSAWAAKVFTNNKVYYISIPKMSSPGLLLTFRVGQQANCCRAT